MLHSLSVESRYKAEREQRNKGIYDVFVMVLPRIKLRVCIAVIRLGIDSEAAMIEDILTGLDEHNNE